MLVIPRPSIWTPRAPRIKPWWRLPRIPFFPTLKYDATTGHLLYDGSSGHLSHTCPPDNPPVEGCDELVCIEELTVVIAGVTLCACGVNAEEFVGDANGTFTVTETSVCSGIWRAAIPGLTRNNYSGGSCTTFIGSNSCSIEIIYNSGSGTVGACIGAGTLPCGGSFLVFVGATADCTATAEPYVITNANPACGRSGTGGTVTVTT